MCTAITLERRQEVTRAGAAIVSACSQDDQTLIGCCLECAEQSAKRYVSMGKRFASEQNRQSADIEIEDVTGVTLTIGIADKAVV